MLEDICEYALATMVPALGFVVVVSALAHLGLVTDDHGQVLGPLAIWFYR